MFDLSNYPLAVIFSIGLAAILIVGEIGWQLGIHAKGEAGSNFSTLESAMLGLLALMLAFTFSMALTRFEARRDALLNEANAIGTTAPTDGVSSVNVPAIIYVSDRCVYRPAQYRMLFRRPFGNRQKPWRPKTKELFPRDFLYSRSMR